MKTLAYYISGHGFGHARRASQVLRTLADLKPDLNMKVRTTAPPAIFAAIPRAVVSAPDPLFDPGVVERDTLSIDPAASLRRLAETLRHRDALVRHEADFLRGSGASLAVADIPFLAGDAARAAGIPSIAVGNFTWDWIFEPFATTAADRRAVDEIKRSYRKMDALLHLPLGHDVDCFKKVVDVPLLAIRSTVDRAATLTQIGLSKTDPRPRVLVAMRGGVSEIALRRAATAAPEFLYVVNQQVPTPLPNLHCLNPTSPADFSDVLAACDVVISKLGYGIVSDCIANGVALLYPPRTGFREDLISQARCPSYLRMRSVSASDFEGGNWFQDLIELLKQPAPPKRLDLTGDQVIARRILAHIDESAQ